MITVPHFGTKKELIHWMVSNKQLLESQKKFSIKYADCVIAQPAVNTSLNQNAEKSESAPVEINAKLAINTTNWFDSHLDVHIPGLWSKSLAETKLLYLLQEHKMEFAKIISDEVKASVANYSFRELGFDVDGSTQALVFDVNIKADRNPYMFNQYKNGWVKNHSVGMRYVKIVMCVNDEDYGAEYEAWQKYFPMVANKKECEDKGYFWAVTEAKLIEGSAVPIGSNTVTPVLEINQKAADNGTSNTEPLNSTQNQPNVVNWDKIAQAII